MPNTEYLKIPKERVGVLIGPHGKTKDIGTIFVPKAIATILIFLNRIKNIIAKIKIDVAAVAI